MTQSTPAVSTIHTPVHSFFLLASPPTPCIFIFTFYFISRYFFFATNCYRCWRSVSCSCSLHQSSYTLRILFSTSRRSSPRYTFVSARQHFHYVQIVHVRIFTSCTPLSPLLVPSSSQRYNSFAVRRSLPLGFPLYVKSLPILQARGREITSRSRNSTSSNSR